MPRKRRVVVPVATASVVTFFLGDEECALPITDVQQIIRKTSLTKVPNLNQHVEGVINLRGVVLPILDLKHMLGLGRRVLGERHRLLIVEHEQRTVGFSVDSIGEIFEFEESRLHPVPDMVLAKVSRKLIKGVVRRAESIVVLLDTKELFKMRIDAGALDRSAGSLTWKLSSA